MRGVIAAPIAGVYGCSLGGTRLVHVLTTNSRVCTRMNAIDAWSPSARELVNRMIHVYGESGTGKSYIITHLMDVLCDHVPQIVVFSPTNPQNHVYDACGRVPRVFIHTRVDANVLNDIWERQACMREVYDRANNIDVLHALFSRVQDRDALAAERQLREKFAETVAALRDTLPPEIAKDRAREHEDSVNEALTRLYKAIINANADRLRQQPLSDDERRALKFRLFMPRLLMIFDDCTEDLRKGAGSDIMQKLFFKGRHLFITCIMACHHDKTFTPELKKQIFVSIYTAPEGFSTYVDRPSNGMDKQQRALAHAAKDMIFTSLNPHQKLVWDRQRKKYYKWTASPSGCEFCAPIVRKYADIVQRRADDSMRGNKFASKFG